MKIIELRAENVKRLVAVTIRPDSNLVEITGRNGQGKTSVLDSIWWALAGTDAIQARPIRNGETSARIEVDLGRDGVTELLVERRFTEKGSYLSVRNAEGFKSPGPQKMLDDLLGSLSFDPLAFMRQDGKRQGEILRTLVGLDFSDIDARRATLYAERTDINRDGKNAAGALDQMPVIAPDTPDEPVDPSTISMELDAAREAEAAERDRQARLRLAERDHQLAADALARATAAEKDARQELEAAEAVDPVAVPDVESLMAKIRDVQRINRAVDQKRERARVEARLNTLREQSRATSQAIADLDAKKAERIASASMPVPDLGFSDEGVVTFGGLPLDQASDAQQLEISTAIAAALNPKLRVIRIRDGSLLDDEAMKRLAAWADERDMQVWIERVDSSGAVGIVIEDGQIASAEAAS